MHGGLYTEYASDLKTTLYDRLFDAALLLAIRTGRDVIVDNLNHTEAKREKLIDTAKKNEVSVVCTVFERNHPRVHLLRRLQDDRRGYGNKVWREVAYKTDKEWEEPNTLEGFDHITVMRERAIDDVKFHTEMGINSIGDSPNPNPEDEITIARDDNEKNLRPREGFIKRFRKIKPQKQDPKS